jgi:hypothetical protein
MGAAEAGVESQLAAGPAQAADDSPVHLSTNVLEVLRLAEARVEEEVIVAYIENSRGPFALTAEDLIYLKDLGVESSLVAAMLRHDTVLEEQQFQSGVTNQATFSPTPPVETNLPAASTPPPVYVTNASPDVVYFYNTLAPYGAWVDLDELGWCWQPNIVVINRYWRPYWQGGRWIYTDCGWYWQSDYSWGWAVFHHGRWHHHHRQGWVWFPDRVWAPAWVSWRYSDTHCGWAPLPPGARFEIGHGFRFHNASVGINFDFGLAPDHFSFVEIRHLHERHPHLHAVTAPRAQEVFRQTTVVNNYVSGSNNRIINQGLAVERVASASRSPIHQVSIRDARPGAGQPDAPDRIERVGSTSVLYRPQLERPRSPAPAVAQRIDEKHPVVRPTLRPPPGVAAKPALPPSGMRTRPAPSSKPPSIPPARREERPSVPPPPRSTQPVPSTPRQPALSPARPGVSRTVPPRGPRFESPRGREQRLSNGQRMQLPRKPPVVQQPPSRRPAEPRAGSVNVRPPGRWSPTNTQ